ncbi:small integral membrane protein 24 isoform X2 [Pseudophryne corroboree]|uniref:small integral membrane protein 24 isoform X2 n=1 Tax=Pseudophryne corroboree TaxID=495146 RepID=UPI003081C5FA
MITFSTILGLLLVISTNAQQDVRQASPADSPRVLQPWLLGLTAVTVFLFIVFILMIINRVWCKKDKEEHAKEENNIERVNMNIYDNEALDEEEVDYNKEEKKENKKATGQWEEKENEEQKVTAM